MAAAHTHTHTHHINGDFPYQPGLASCHPDSEFLMIIILSILSEQAKTLHTDTLLQVISCPLNSPPS